MTRWELRLSLTFFAAALVCAWECRAMDAAQGCPVTERVGPGCTNVEVDRRGYLTSNGNSGDRAEAETQPQRWSTTNANAAATSTPVAAPRIIVPYFALGHPICPDGYCVAQEYVEWKRVDGVSRIVKRTWVVYPATHKVKWLARKNQLRRI